MYRSVGRIFGVGIVLASVAAVVAAQGQGQSSSAPVFKQRTPWGHPDLQGEWTNTTTTPLERPAALAGKTALTDQERAELDAQAARAAAERQPRPGEVIPYNAHWFEKGKQSIQTSLVVDPPDGRLPPLTPAAEAPEAAKGIEGRRRRPEAQLVRRLRRLRPLHYAGAARGHDARLLQPQLQHSSDSQLRGHLGRNDPRCSNYSSGWAAAPFSEHSRVAWGFARTLGGRHARG